MARNKEIVAHALHRTTRTQARSDPDSDPRANKPSDAARVAGKDIRAIEADHTPTDWAPATDERRPAKTSVRRKPLIKRSPTESAAMSSGEHERMMLVLARQIAARRAAINAGSAERIEKRNQRLLDIDAYLERVQRKRRK